MINTEAALQEFLPRMEGADWIAVDTEADSLHAYPEKICLIQIGIPDGDFLVDPLAGFNLSPLWEVLQDRELILHGADYDLRLLRRQYGFIPFRIFDTMLAGRLIGCAAFGLRDLVKQYLNVELEKGSQTANWARRPLTPKMETYARNDTHYLHPLSDRLKKQLKNFDRIPWHEETCERLIRDASRPEPVDENLVWRIKGSSRLGPRGLAVLRAAWHWREQEAIDSSKPPYFVLKHEHLIRIAEQSERSSQGGIRIPGRLTDRRRHSLVRTVEEGMDLPLSKCPKPLPRKGRRSTESELREFDRLKARRDSQAEALKIDPALIASKATLIALSRDWEENSKDLMNWQRTLLAES